MYEHVLNAIIEELKPGQCIRDIGTYWTFRSTVPGPGLSRASEFLCRRHREHGLQAEIKPYPADDKTEWVDGRKNPLAWVPRSARLEIVEPTQETGMLCTYADEPLSLISNSTGTPVEGIEAPVVVIYGANKDKAYNDVDVAGNIIFTDLSSFEVEEQARKRGAIGVVTDCVCPPWLRTMYPPVREPEDVPDITMWSIFNGHRHDTDLWGFNLSPRQGRHLRDVIQRSPAPVILRATVDADLKEGTSELVSAVLPGTDLAHEEIWVLAHSSEPGAEDNASGCCLSLELARTLKILVDRGELQPLRRSIRFLNAAEIEGYLPYLHERRNELDCVVAGLCLDALGNDLRISGAAISMVRTPTTNASFVDGFLEYLFKVVSAEPNKRFASDTYAAFTWHTERFLANDGFISDSFFDIPTPEISTWPQKFYHSSHDTPDKISENSLGRVGAIAGMYLYILATAGPSEAFEFAGLAAWDWKRRICDDLHALGLQDGTASPDERASQLRSMGRQMGLQARDAVTRTLRWAPSDRDLSQAIQSLGDELERFAVSQSEQLVRTVFARTGQPSPAPDEVSVSTGMDLYVDKVLKRLRWQLPSNGGFSQSGKAQKQMLHKQGAQVEQVWDWINGKRSVSEIWARAQTNTRMDVSVVYDLLCLLESEGLVVEVARPAWLPKA
jgi:hypothetical protein